MSVSLPLWLAVGVLGGVAAVLRVLVEAAASGGELPVGTLVVNASGSLVLGLLAGAAVHGDAYLLVATAGIGSYTTFSTWMLQSERALEGGRVALAAGNVVLSLLVGVGAVELGRLIAGG